MVFGNSHGWTQISAATSNASFGSQLFGVTSGTSNCSDPGNNARGAHAFIETNREMIAKEMARGSGETIANFSALMGCPDARSVGASLQRSFKQIFPDDSVSTDQVTEQILSTLRNDNLACVHLG